MDPIEKEKSTKVLHESIHPFTILPLFSPSLLFSSLHSLTHSLTPSPCLVGFAFSKIWEKFFGDEEVKLIIVGLDNAGKTTTLYKLLLGEVVLTKPTIGSNVEEIVHENIRFQMWDIGGQASLRKSWDTYYSGAKAIILVIDSTDQEYISVAKTELDAMLDHEDLRNSVLLVFANKQDLKDSMEPADISEHLDLDSIKDHDWHIQGCCALTGEGLTEGLDWISSKVNT
eukprot:TRINITY_DN2018_c0_g1_i4.p1 TRINITY_DN2018_c0_g1~~TRINITY_DN2018_c0_g1_i4.p1  ORF type:complete len:228 (-),score=22.56 TRINITY_DN2018_c0_g1_i4:70-753(-)